MALKRLNDDLGIALISAAIIVFALFSSATPEKVGVLGFSIPTLCGFKLLTTLDCPGCGLTRSLILAMHGKFAASYFMHIWGIPLLLILFFQVPYRLLRYRNPSFSVPKLPNSVKKWISHAIFLSILIPWAFKIIAWAVIRYL